MNGQVATQEELDNVIDFLSGPKVASMQAIPENLPPHSQPGPPSRAVGSQLGHNMYSTPPPPLNMGAGDGLARGIYSGLGPEQPEAPPVPQYRGGHQHRRSDGGLIAEQLARESKTNTWPYRPNTRPSAGVTDYPTPYPTYNTFDGLGGNDLEYSRYLASVVNKQMKQGASNSMASMVPPQGPWANAAQVPLNKSWPVNLFNSDGYISYTCVLARYSGC